MALDRRALTTRSQRRSTPNGHGSMTHHRPVHGDVSMRRSIGCEDIGRHEATLHSRAWSSLGVKGSWVRIPPSRQCELEIFKLMMYTLDSSCWRALTMALTRIRPNRAECSRRRQIGPFWRIALDVKLSA